MSPAAAPPWRARQAAPFLAAMGLALAAGSPVRTGAPASSAPDPSPESPPEIEARFVPAGRFPWTEAYAYLPEVSVETVNDERATVTRLYQKTGELDPEALALLDAQLADKRRPGDVRHATIDRRLLALVFKAAFHFGATRVRVVSAFRDPFLVGKHAHREGFHGKGAALDFKLEGVRAPDLARWLREELAQVGVGQYTHPRTQFVHLDVRALTFHWADGSAPGRRGGIGRIPTEGTAARDQAHRPEDDLPDLSR